MKVFIFGAGAKDYGLNDYNSTDVYGNRSGTHLIMKNGLSLTVIVVANSVFTLGILRTLAQNELDF